MQIKNQRLENERKKKNTNVILALLHFSLLKAKLLVDIPRTKTTKFYIKQKKQKQKKTTKQN